MLANFIIILKINSPDSSVLKFFLFTCKIALFTVIIIFILKNKEKQLICVSSNAN